VVLGLGFLLWVVFRVDLLKVMVGLWLHLSIVFLVGFLMEKMSIVPDLPQFHLSIAGKIDLSTGEILPMSLRRI